MHDAKQKNTWWISWNFHIHINSAVFFGVPWMPKGQKDPPEAPLPVGEARGMCFSTNDTGGSTQELVVLTQVTRVDDRNVPCPRFMLGWYNLNVTEFIWYIFIHIYIHIHTYSTGTGNSVTLPCPLVSDPKSFQDGRVGSFRRRRSALVNGLISGSFYRKPWLFSCTSKGKSKPCKVSLQPAFPKIG
jgi:hypothetical protein